MQHLDHDMDELFQKAAEGYQLKDGKSNWDAIASRIPGSSPVASPIVKKPSGRKKYLLLFTLLAMILLLIDIITRTQYNTYKPGISNYSTAKVTTNNNNLNQSIEKNNASEVIIPAGISGEAIPDDIKRDLKSSKNNKRFSNNNDTRKIEIDNPKTKGFDSPVLLRNNNYINLENMKPPTASLKSEMKTRNSPMTLPSHSNNNNPVLNNDRGFYYGVVAGPQLSEVRQQGMQKTGFEIGIPVGYRINNKFAIESGIFHSEKYYYSSGKHFIMSKPDPSMPANMILLDLQGKSNLFEIPIKIRYDFLNHPHNKFFVSAGLSSYILTKEKNDYHAMVNGTEEYMKKSYNETCGYVAAGFNLSAGFEHRISKNSSIRIQPYMQIPLKGIGVGNMPVSSAGIHIGIITGKRKQ